MAISSNILATSEGSERLNSLISRKPITVQTSEQRTHCPGVKVGGGDGELCWTSLGRTTAWAGGRTQLPQLQPPSTDKTIPHRKLPYMERMITTGHAVGMAEGEETLEGHLGQPV